MLTATGLADINSRLARARFPSAIMLRLVCARGSIANRKLYELICAHDEADVDGMRRYYLAWSFYRPNNNPLICLSVSCSVRTVPIT